MDKQTFLDKYSKNQSGEVLSSEKIKNFATDIHDIIPEVKSTSEDYVTYHVPAQTLNLSQGFMASQTYTYSVAGASSVQVPEGTFKMIAKSKKVVPNASDSSKNVTRMALAPSLEATEYFRCVENSILDQLSTESIVQLGYVTGSPTLSSLGLSKADFDAYTLVPSGRKIGTGFWYAPMINAQPRDVTKAGGWWSTPFNAVCGLGGQSPTWYGSTISLSATVTDSSGNTLTVGEDFVPSTDDMPSMYTPVEKSKNVSNGMVTANMIDFYVGKPLNMSFATRTRTQWGVMPFQNAVCMSISTHATIASGMDLKPTGSSANPSSLMESKPNIVLNL